MNIIDVKLFVPYGQSICEANTDALSLQNKGETPLVGSPFRTRSHKKPRPLGEVAAAMFAKQTCHEAKRSRKADGEGYNQKRYLT